ncbi:T9SS type A sorting domain-containing protein [Hymenobacter terricola]|uniref:T9SS type A sorting domain-containing protein n=1 Tax=Hymenobacter terricola TaxID=2819236 RepID=UPI001B302AD4|nr:T9SS type A sorting domain-containing protein [Hymenobacter terricola]
MPFSTFFQSRTLLFWGVLLAGLKPLHAQTLDPAFQPTVAYTATLQPGTVRALYQQPDGRILVAGDFAVLNNWPTTNIARLWPDGRVDTTFTAPAFTGGPVLALVGDAQGRVVVVGNFGAVNGLPRAGAARLLPSGALDPSFIPNLRAASSSLVPSVRAVVVQPDGNIILGGYFGAAGANGAIVPHVIRVLPNGLPDASFVPAMPYSGQVNALLLQASGALLVAGNTYSSPFGLELVRRLLPNGSLDPTFNLVPANQTVAGAGLSMASTPTGFVLAGAFISVGSQTRASVARFLADGTLDATFTSPLPNVMPATQLNAVAVEPTGNVVIGGAVSTGGLRRLLPTGAFDNTYFNPAVIAGTDGDVFAIVPQPNGNVLVGGSFVRIAGQRRYGLARVLAPGALAVATPRAAAELTIYPTPAHDQLHVQLDAAATPQTLALLDMLGRPVFMRQAPAAETTLPTAHLSPGIYLLRVAYATGSVSRRIVIQ